MTPEEEYLLRIAAVIRGLNDLTLEIALQSADRTIELLERHVANRSYFDDVETAIVWADSIAKEFEAISSYLTPALDRLRSAGAPAELQAIHDRFSSALAEYVGSALRAKEIAEGNAMRDLSGSLAQVADVTQKARDRLKAVMAEMRSAADQFGVAAAFKWPPDEND